MTVRAWFTISAIALVALGATFAFWAFRPIQAPELLARVGETRLEGTKLGSCWPQGDGELRCEDPDTEPGDGPAVPASGTLEIIAAYPVQPEGGEIRVLEADTDDVVEDAGYVEELEYTLDAGRYVLDVRATYRDQAFVRYAFPFRVGGS